MSNLGKWDRWYSGLTEDQPHPYGSTETYEAAAEFLEPCELVEDWGCGKGYMRELIGRTRYRGLDGSRTPFADLVVDLTQYSSEVDGIFMRHVLEHNYEWAKILENAVSSFRSRFCLVLFTPLVEETKEIFFTEDVGVPDLAFKREDITTHFEGLAWEEKQYSTTTNYDTETVFFIRREG